MLQKQNWTHDESWPQAMALPSRSSRMMNHCMASRQVLCISIVATTNNARYRHIPAEASLEDKVFSSSQSLPRESKMAEIVVFMHINSSIVENQLWLMRIQHLRKVLLKSFHETIITNAFVQADIQITPVIAHIPEAEWKIRAAMHRECEHAGIIC